MSEKYEDNRLIGSGGFGEVFLCTSKTDGQLFAKKKLQSGVDSVDVSRFIREVRILSSLDHPNVIKASVNTPVHEVAEKMLKNNISHIPVVNSDDRLIGMVTDIDLMACMF